MHSISSFQVPLPVVSETAGLIRPAVPVELAIRVTNRRKLVEPILQKLTVLLYREVVVGFEIAVVINEQVCIIADSIVTYGKIPISC